MKKTLCSFFLLLFLLSAGNVSAQNEKADKFWKTLQTYYFLHDKSLVNQTIDYLNAGVYDANVFELRFRAFYCALFSVDGKIKADFQSKLKKIKSAELEDMFETITNSNIDDIYANAPETPDANEMLCYSYYATGDSRYIDRLLEKAKGNDERKDLDKYMIGANAIWWLATLRDENILVKQYLEAKTANKAAEIALTNRAYDLKNIQLDVLADQKKKGIWK